MVTKVYLTHPLTGETKYLAEWARYLGWFKEPFHCRYKKYLAGQLSLIELLDTQHSSKRWSNEELFYLESLIGRYSNKEIIEKIQWRANRHGFKFRSRAAILDKIYKLTNSSLPSEDNISFERLRSLLKITVHRANKIKENINYKKVSSTRYSIQISELKKLAYRKPKLFSSANREALLWLFEDEQLVDKCLSFDPTIKSSMISVKRLDTGIIYRSFADAAKSINYHSTHFARQIKNNKMVDGTYWEII